MSFPSHPATALLGEKGEQLRSGQTPSSKPWSPSWASSLRLILALLVVSLLFTFICFWGRKPLDFRFLPGQKVQSSIVAQVPFSYISSAETKRLIAEKRSQLVPIYKVDLEPFELFSRDLWELNALLDTLGEQMDGDERLGFPLQHAIENFNRQHSLKVDWMDLSILLRALNPGERAQVFKEALIFLREIASDGIFADHRQDFSPNSFSKSPEATPRRQFENSNVRSMESALRNLRIHLLSMDLEQDTLQALFRLMKLGVRSNLLFDTAANEERLQQVLVSTPKVRKHVSRGSTLVSEGALISNEDYEKLSAYHKALHIDEQKKAWFHDRTFQDFVRTLILLSFTFLTLFSLKPSLRESKKDILLLLTAMGLNLLLIRLLLQITELSFFQGNSAVIHALFQVIPFSLGAMLLMIFHQVPSALCCSVATSLSYAFMAGKGLSFFLLFLASSFAALLLCHSAYLRSQVLRAGLISGLLFALGIFFSESSIGAISPSWMEAMTPAISGLLSGLLALGILPILERIFHYTSDLKLFELYDYNHPLMQRLQATAPGSYHHSLSVSNIAEQAALAVDANPILCRTAALYHDIGKLEKPEYFIENQREEENYHDSKKAEISAIIIKNHIREGLRLGEKAKLPRPILDIIQQHHGDSLIGFFHQKAKSQQERNEESLPNEGSFRYDGPKPQTKEAAIVCLADAAEAASRVQKKQPSLKEIEELVAHLIRERIENHQFDECPLTLQDFGRLQKVITAILFSAAHTRISYDLVRQRKP
ncbi:MAG: HDIG domain-containing protein [Puniceicoccales bacterium]|nr:HDIG domain-containing protein [Puniceicoccales bacterium]